MQAANAPARAASVATAATTVMIEAEKFGSLKTCLPLAIFLGVAWTFYHSRRDLFHSEGVAYIALCGISFSATSISMHTLNKVCVSLTGAPSTLTTIQMAVTVIATLVFNGREVLGADRKKLCYWMVVPVVYAGMLNSSLLGYKYLSLCLVTVFRNLSPLVTMTVEGFIMDAEHRPTVTMPVVGSLLMMVVGALVFSYGQGAATWIGLALVTMNTLLAIGDRVLQRRLLVSECKDLPLSACMTLNNSLGMLPTFAMALASHEVDGYEAHHAAWTDPTTLLLIALSGVMGMGIGFYGLMCQRAMTATSFQVLQNMSKVAVVAVGIVVFGDRMDSPARIGGMALSLMGSAAYGWARTSESKSVPDVIVAKGECKPLLGGRFAPFSAAVLRPFCKRRSPMDAPAKESA